MNHTQLRSFHTSALLGGFTAAAKALHISQPTITTQVRALEAQYGVELFIRSGRNVVLTPVGEELFAITKACHTAGKPRPRSAFKPMAAIKSVI